MAELTDIRQANRASRRRRLYLDGCEWRAVPEEVVRALGLRVGQSHEPALLESRIAEAEPAQAWERAQRLLNFRDRGSGELRARLLDDGYATGVVDGVVEHAVDLGFLDDVRFATGLARKHAGGKNRGRRRVAAELAAKGVDDALAAEVLAECCSPEEEREHALALARRTASSGTSDPARIAAKLCRSGFETGLAWSVAREVAEGANVPSDEG